MLLQKIIRFLVHLGVAALVFVFLVALIPTILIVRDRSYERARRVQLLYKTDHQVLLDACRELLQRADRGELKLGTMYSIRTVYDPKVLTFPRIVLDLQPTFVFLQDGGSVTLEMLGGFVHCGVHAYPETVKESAHPGFDFGDKKLLDGLWYYDDGYDTRGKAYDRYIESLRPRRQRHTTPASG